MLKQIINLILKIKLKKLNIKQNEIIMIDFGYKFDKFSMASVQKLKELLKSKNIHNIIAVMYQDAIIKKLSLEELKNYKKQIDTMIYSVENPINKIDEKV